ncbi:myo-inositol oxygenase [Rhinolophus ferrumequinum]|uniref:Inositol oxygenase n=2 Tax=Rhinolophus ferrumequinum TaxID=59479 RepID=A0A7J7QY38_RHIFE|nr:inositol oxygenase [Rhinolophus ferrumequinum]KAF6268854.1 myo-inositol oxygenase [Rhinolophus ferrumequinum]
MVTHYQGPRSRGWVVSGHLCNLWAYIGAHSPVGLLPTCQLRSLRMKVAVGPDPSLVYRPELDPEAAKDKGSFRNYTSGPLLDRVFATYKLMHSQQTVDFVKKKHAQFGSFSYKKMTVLEAVDMLDGLIDESDPDVDFPNSFHAFQTAEGIRKAHPDKDWFHLVGLLHDLGKVLALAGEPQWAVVGDTFPVGCRPQASVVFCDSTFQDNPDLQDPRYSTELGMYQPHCGLENVLMSWGHDEYMYQMMKFNKFSLPPEAFYMIRFHSFYPWHTGGDYRQLCGEQDLAMLPWVQEFNKFDLYTKCPDLPDVDKLRPYYQGLIDKYCPGVLSW